MHFFFALEKTFRNSDALFGQAGMPPPLWHPYHGILTYYLYGKSRNFPLI